MQDPSSLNKFPFTLAVPTASTFLVDQHPELLETDLAKKLFHGNLVTTEPQSMATIKRALAGALNEAEEAEHLVRKAAHDETWRPEPLSFIAITLVALFLKLDPDLQNILKKFIDVVFEEVLAFLPFLTSFFIPPAYSHGRIGVAVMLLFVVAIIFFVSLLFELIRHIARRYVK